MFKIETLNLDNNSSFSQGFAPSIMKDAEWEIVLDGIVITELNVQIPIKFTSKPYGKTFDQIRVLTHTHKGDVNLGIEKMDDFVSYLYGIALSQPELKDSTL